MFGLSAIFDIALSAIKASQISMGVVANNVANASNPDYVRKEPVLSEKPSDLSSTVGVGRGVDVVRVRRVIDEFVSSQWRKELSRLGYRESESELLSRIDGVFNEMEGGGVSSALDEFWNAWEELSADPSNMVKRAVVVDRAKDLIAQIKSKSSYLEDLRSDTRRGIESVVDKINSITKKVADLNAKIMSLSGRSTGLEGFKDERDALLRDLAQLVDIDVVRTNTSIEVYVGGAPIVDAGKSYELSYNPREGKVEWEGEAGARADITSRISGGKLGGYLEVERDIIPYFIDSLDKLSYNLVVKVNEIHSSGYGLGDTTGVNFFKPLSSESAAAQSIEVNPDVENDISLVAASSQPNQPGNNENALRIANLRETIIPELGDKSFNGFYAHMVGFAGSKAEDSKTALDHQKLLVKGIKEDFESISGVNLDEEAANLVKYQQMYNASAKIITMANEMFETLINIGT